MPFVDTVLPAPAPPAMRTAIYRVSVEFGDCDPANIVFYPNFYRWFDAATHHLLNEAGLGWTQLRARYGAVGMPLMETGAVYRRPATSGDLLEIQSSVVECTRKSVRLQHLVWRDGELLVDGFEVRILGAPHPDDPKRLRMLEIPDEIRDALMEEAR
jgi:4-hydroxybenzoyl-CoA thioesterase